jgi:hypothetical protein
MTQQICWRSGYKRDKNFRKILESILNEDAEVKSNYQKIIDNFKNRIPFEYHESLDEAFGVIRKFIESNGYRIRISKSAGFMGVRTKDFIIVSRPSHMHSLADFVYTVFHEIRHEIQMGELKQNNPLSGDIEDFEELYSEYWKMEMDAHNYSLKWVKKIGDIVGLPESLYRLSSYIRSYPTSSRTTRSFIVGIDSEIRQLKAQGLDYSDLSDLPMIKALMSELEDMFE